MPFLNCAAHRVARPVSVPLLLLFAALPLQAATVSYLLDLANHLPDGAGYARSAAGCSH